MIHSYGVTFGDVRMAYEIFDFSHAIKLKDSSRIEFKNLENGSCEKPVPGCILIWHEGGEFEKTGHIAIVTEVTDTYVRIAEQNVNDSHWGGRNYARQLKVDYNTKTGEYFIHETWGERGGRIKGWKLLPSDLEYDPIPHPPMADHTVSANTISNNNNNAKSANSSHNTNINGQIDGTCR